MLSYVNDHYTETLAEDFIPYFCLYERCLYMHNLVLEKAEELENDYKESINRYKSKLKVKNAQIESHKREIEALQIEKNPIFDKYI